MTANEDLEPELNKLRSSADSLAQCLGTLLKRIEDLEESHADKKLAANGSAMRTSPPHAANDDATAQMLRRIAAAIGGDERTARRRDAKEISRREFITIDPVNGAKKKTIVTECVLDSNVDLNPSVANKMRTVSPLTDKALDAFRPRIVSVARTLLERIQIEFFAGDAIVLSIPPEAIMTLVRPGDSILEVSGQRAIHKKQFHAPYAAEKVTLKLVSSDIFALPSNFCKILDDYRANACDTMMIGTLGPPSTVNSHIHQDQPSTSRGDAQPHQHQNGYASCISAMSIGTTVAESNLLPYLSFDLKKGDVLQIISQDKMCMQARKVDDLSASGFVPPNIQMERVAMLSPYGRRVIALLGANGVGRRTLKRMLLQRAPSRFAADVPLTSRAPKSGEVDGREFHFVIKEKFLELIRANQMIEWGESNGHLYGTYAENVRQIIRSGRVCVLDCTERALKLLYTREFAPYVIVIAAPASRDELARLAALRAADECLAAPTAAMLDNTWDENQRLLRSPYAKLFNLVLVNRNFDVTLRRLMDALEHLRNESQWIPLDWIF